MNYIDVYEFGKTYNIIKGSAVPDLKNIRSFLESLDITLAVEIGTAYGLSSAFFAQYADEVHTFDVKTYPCLKLIWDSLRVRDKITRHIVKHTKETSEILKAGKINPDFVFIDGRHEVEEVKKDFSLMKKYGRILFHDTDPERYPENAKFVRDIGAKEIENNLSYWEH
jgi:cephalosporin hydroxylase